MAENIPSRSDLQRAAEAARAEREAKQAYWDQLDREYQASKRVKEAAERAERERQGDAHTRQNVEWAANRGEKGVRWAYGEDEYSARAAVRVLSEMGLDPKLDVTPAHRERVTPIPDMAALDSYEDVGPTYTVDVSWDEK